MPDERKHAFLIDGSVIKTIIVAVSAICVVFRYLSHERESALLARDQQRLALSQSRAMATAQKEIEQQRAVQLQLTNEQARLALATQETSQKLRLEEQRITTAVAQFALDVQKSQQQLRQDELRMSLELKRLEGRKARHDLAYSTGQRYAKRFQIASRPAGPPGAAVRQFRIDHGFEFENLSESDIEVTLVAIDYYVGAASDAADSITVTSIGAPPDRWNAGSDQPGALVWKRAGGTASVLESASVDVTPIVSSTLNGIAVVRGGPGTGYLKPGEDIEYTDTYFVRAPADAYVLFVTSYCFNRCKNDGDFHSYMNWVSLGDGTRDSTFHDPDA